MTSIELKRKFWGRMLWISAISLSIAVLLAILLPVLGMFKAFSSLKKSGAADPSELAAEISSSIMVGMLAIPFAFAALILFIIAILRLRKFSDPRLAD